MNIQSLILGPILTCLGIVPSFPFLGWHRLYLKLLDHYVSRVITCIYFKERQTILYQDKTKSEKTKLFVAPFLTNKSFLFVPPFITK